MISHGTISYDLRHFSPNAKVRSVAAAIFGKNGRMPPRGDKVSLEESDAIWAYALAAGKP